MLGVLMEEVGTLSIDGGNGRVMIGGIGVVMILMLFVRRHDEGLAMDHEQEEARKMMSSSSSSKQEDDEERRQNNRFSQRPPSKP